MFDAGDDAPPTYAPARMPPDYHPAQLRQTPHARLLPSQPFAQLSNPDIHRNWHERKSSCRPFLVGEQHYFRNQPTVAVQVISGLYHEHSQTLAVQSRPGDAAGQQGPSVPIDVVDPGAVEDEQRSDVAPVVHADVQLQWSLSGSVDVVDFCSVTEQDGRQSQTILVGCDMQRRSVPGVAVSEAASAVDACAVAYQDLRLQCAPVQGGQVERWTLLSVERFDVSTGLAQELHDLALPDARRSFAPNGDVQRPLVATIFGVHVGAIAQQQSDHFDVRRLAGEMKSAGSRELQHSVMIGRYFWPQVGAAASLQETFQNVARARSGSCHERRFVARFKVRGGAIDVDEDETPPVDVGTVLYEELDER